MGASERIDNSRTKCALRYPLRERSRSCEMLVGNLGRVILMTTLERTSGSIAMLSWLHTRRSSFLAGPSFQAFSVMVTERRVYCWSLTSSPITCSNSVGRDRRPFITLRAVVGSRKLMFVAGMVASRHTCEE